MFLKINEYKSLLLNKKNLCFFIVLFILLSKDVTTDLLYDYSTIKKMYTE
jgi:hypothetical protein